MVAVKKLTREEVEIALASRGLAGWKLKAGKLHRDYAFEDFIRAFGFMATSAIAIEAQNHHPEWSNVWNKVSVDLVTHDAGGITKKDVELARTLETFATQLGGA